MSSTTTELPPSLGIGVKGQHFHLDLENRLVPLTLPRELSFLPCRRYQHLSKVQQTLPPERRAAPAVADLTSEHPRSRTYSDRRLSTEPLKQQIVMTSALISSL